MITSIQIVNKDMGDVKVFTFIGAIDETNADEIFKNIFEQLTGNKLIFDFGMLTYGNSKFMGYLSKIYELLEEKNGQMYIVNCVEPVRDILDICGILQIIPNTSTLNEALEKMGVNEESIIK